MAVVRSPDARGERGRSRTAWPSSRRSTWSVCPRTPGATPPPRPWPRRPRPCAASRAWTSSRPAPRSRATGSRSTTRTFGSGSASNAEGPRPAAGDLRGRIGPVPLTILVGAQWGDEGKGKATDLMAGRSDLVVRCQGGTNAGHTILAGGQLLKLRLVPSGILYPNVTPVIADGVVIDPTLLLEEMDALAARGIDVSRAAVSGNAHLIMPYHRELDRVTERFLGKHALGTT